MRVLARIYYSHSSIPLFMRASALKPRKQPRQDRSSAMVALILQAAARVLEREALAGFNTNRVAAVAGISVGSLYQYFPNKAALIAALIEQSQQELARTLQACVEETQGLTLIASVRKLARFAINQQYGKPLLAAALDYEEQRLPIQKVLQANELLLGASALKFLEQHREQLSCAVSPSVARDILTITKAMVESDAQRSRLPPIDLEDRMTRALLGYLQCPVG
jgi:AcrR family transcriptional regulator